MGELLPWLNLLLVPTFGYVLAIARYLVSLDTRLTRLEAIHEAEKEARSAERRLSTT